MKKHADGFILLLTLNIISVMSMLLLLCIQNVLLFHKAINQRAMQHQRFYELEHLAWQLAKEAKTIKPECYRYQDAPNQMLRQLLDNKGCLGRLGQNSYRYFIEDLGDYPCHKTLYQQEQRATHHFRISLFLMADKENSGSLLQVRMIQPTIPLVCMGEEYPVVSGISSWRYFADSDSYQT